MIPLALFALLLDSPGPRISGSPLVLLLGFLVIAPVLETLVECLLPYAIMNRLGRIPSGRRAWGFIGVSAVLMALWHLSAWPAAIVPSLITGAFLAYTFAHFAPESRSRAFLHTWAFHAGINLVGWTLLTIP